MMCKAFVLCVNDLEQNLLSHTNFCSGSFYNPHRCDGGALVIDLSKAFCCQKELFEHLS